MPADLWIVVLVVVVAAVAAVSRRLGVSAPLVLVLTGITGAYLPFVPEVRLDPQVALVGFLAPLLYAAAIRMSLKDIRTNTRPLLFLSVGYVVFATLVVGAVAWWVVPGRSLAGSLRARARSSRLRTRSRRRPSPAGWACRGGWSRSWRARAWSTTRPPWWRSAPRPRPLAASVSLGWVAGRVRWWRPAAACWSAWR